MREATAKSRTPNRQFYLPRSTTTQSFQASIKQKASKSINQANINATILSNERFDFPKSLEDQRSIVSRLNTLRCQTERLESIYQRKLAALDGLKKSLLHQAFSGHV
jgi:type I restriction enzyme S subunit